MNRILLISIGVALFFTSCRNKETDTFAYGNFESEEIIVSAEATGRLVEFSIAEGQKIALAGYCGYIDTTQLYLKKLQLLSGINGVRARLTQLEKQLLVNEVSLSNMVREKKRIAALIEGNAATSKQMDDISGQIDLLNAQTNALISQKAAIRVEAESIEIQVLQVNDLISKSLIKSPATGTVLEKYLNTGELAVTGKALFKMADMSTLILRVFVSGTQLEQIKLGAGVDIFIDSSNGELKNCKGTVSWVSEKSEFTPKIIQTRDERVNLVYAVKIIVPNDGSLKIGMPGEIHL